MKHAAVQKTDEMERVVELLGGPNVLGRKLKSRFDAHDLIKAGFPSQALLHLMSSLVLLKNEASFSAVVGISTRTIQRRKKTPSKLLDQNQSGRTWKFAEILALATEVFGSQIDAEQWMENPVLGLNNRRPIDLMATSAGVEMVEDILARLDFGVYV